jgi:hypothetical protein
VYSAALTGHGVDGDSAKNGIQRAVPERRKQQIVQVTALGRDQRLAVVEDAFEQRLLFERVDQRHC